VADRSDRLLSRFNLTLESFVIHARALLQFLYAETPRPDDVIAEDFFEDPSAWPARSELL
jgi:hypothetical protein